MRWILLVVLLYIITQTDAAKTRKNSQKDLLEPLKKNVKKPITPAIIAIEIVDPKDNSTKTGKGKKRTIDSSLGYGYQNLFNAVPKPPRYEVYKYSQHDIPPYTGPPIHLKNEYTHGGSSFNIQKAIQYDLGSKTEYRHNAQPHYQPGTLFSMVDQNGHVGGLSSHAPSAHNPMVPVIVFRVYTNQLGQLGGLHANIPQNHPYANLNNIDLQSLVAGYYKTHQTQQQPQYQQQQPQSQYHQQQQQHYQYESQEQPADDLPTHENYPDDKHTRVTFHKDTGAKIAKITAPSGQKFKIHVPDETYSDVQVQEQVYEQPQQQYQYEQPVYYEQQPQQQYYQQEQTNQYSHQVEYVQQQQQSQPLYQYVPQGYQMQYVQYDDQAEQQYYEQTQPQHQQVPYQQQADSSQDYELHQASQGTGQDLHTKVYNYHAAETASSQKSEDIKTKKKRKVRRPSTTAKTPEEQ